MKKIILAFSGGLDTTFSVPYLKDKGYDVITVTVDTGGFSPGELSEIAVKSKKLGAIKHYAVDGKKKFFDSAASYIIKSHGLYQEAYPNMCADRYVIAEKCVKIAKKENAIGVAHGSTAMGNDQVRFDVALMMLAPELQIITPIREMGGNRKKEQCYLESKGFPIASLHKKYSVNQNLLGVTYSGSEIDKLEEPDASMFSWTKHTKANEERFIVGFTKGVPVNLNGKISDGWQILQKLNHLLGAHGYGKAYYTGDCVIGIKGHIAFEAPGILGLIEAHKALQQLVLTKAQQTLAWFIGEQFTDLVYTGKMYEPAMANLKCTIDSLQDNLSGFVTLLAGPGSVQAVAVTSPHSLIHSEVAAYAQGCSWTAQDAKGFILLHGMQGKIASMVTKKYVLKGGENHD